MPVLGSKAILVAADVVYLWAGYVYELKDVPTWLYILSLSPVHGGKKEALYHWWQTGGRMHQWSQKEPGRSRKLWSCHWVWSPGLAATSPFFHLFDWFLLLFEKVSCSSGYLWWLKWDVPPKSQPFDYLVHCWWLFWGELGSVALLEEVCHQRSVLKGFKRHHFQCSLCSCFSSRCDLSASFSVASSLPPWILSE